MHSTSAMVLLVLILLVPFAHAQSTNLQPLWDAISNLGIAIQAIQQDIQTIQTVGLQFAQDVEAHLHALDDRVDQIQTIGTQVILDMNASIANLQARDENLQGQINQVAVPTPASTHIDRNQIYEVLNNDPYQNSVFCNSPNDILLFGYCAGGFLVNHYSSNQSIFDNFSDLDYTNNPTWTVNQGIWDIYPSIARLQGNGPGSTASSMSTPVSINSVGLSMSFVIEPNQNGEDYYLALTNMQGTLSTQNESGYSLVASVNGNQSILKLLKLWPGGYGVVYQIGAVPLTLHADNNLSMTRDPNGYWRMYADGIQYGVPYFDTNYSQFSYVHLSYAPANIIPGGRIDDVNVQVLSPAPNPSAIVNISDYNSPLGITCQTNGIARVVCLQQS